MIEVTDMNARTKRVRDRGTGGLGGLVGIFRVYNEPDRWVAIMGYE